MKAGLGTITLVVALLVVFGIELATHSVGNEASLLKLGALPDNGALQGQYWRVATYSFLHFNGAHLLVNVRGSLLLVKEFAAQHDGRPGGRVVLMTSGQHLGPMSREVAYAVSKGAIHQATATLSDQLIERGITVNAVNPGPTATGWDVGEPGDRSPLGRWGTPDDAARLIAWLCTDDAQWITGQVIDSEGGYRRR